MSTSATSQQNQSQTPNGTNGVKKEARKIRKPELEEHNKDGDLWVVVSGKVYDLSSFYPTHPGGPQIIMDNGGKDASQIFE